jgi:hypothetical protein
MPPPTAARPVPVSAPAQPAAATALPPTAPLPAAAAPAASKAGLIVGGIAVLIVLVAGGYFGYRLLGANGKETVAAVEPAKPAEIPAASAPAPSTNETPAPSAPEAAAPAAAAEPPPSTATAESPAPTTPDANAKAGAGPAAESPASGTLKAPRAKTPKSATGTETPAKGQPGQQAGALPGAKATAQAAVPAPAPDRWQMFADAMAQCERLDFFSRLGCEQRERWHYCEGYWGTVPQCPGTAIREHGS